ncbi:MAG: tRNA lysidine(34) synthetase TilS [Chloroflexia bacterium]
MSVDLLSAIRSAATELTADERAEPILVGVSGGPDSLALLHALGRWRAEGGPAIAAIHVDHKLRPGSADEARQVAAWCVEWGIPFAGRAVETDRAPVANIEQIAREGRYRCFAAEAARLGALTLALAHHADDQAETLLLHLLRGSGLAGLTGMPVVRRAGDRLDPICAALGVSRPAIWRPLLAVRRAAMLAYCDRWHLAPIHDPSNDDTALRRNAVRHRIVPVLEEYFPGAGGILARNAALLADDEDAARRHRRSPSPLCGERTGACHSRPGCFWPGAPGDAAASVARDLGQPPRTSCSGRPRCRCG